MTNPKRRRGCVGCHLIEAEAGTWIDGLCPRCSALGAMKPASPARYPALPPKQRRDALASIRSALLAAPPTGPNNCSTAEIQRIIQCFLNGVPIREAVRKLGISRKTVRKYYRQFPSELQPRCRCGQVAGHQGWCSERVAGSPKRQDFLKRFAGRGRPSGCRLEP